MKYKAIKNGTERVLHIPVPLKGIDMETNIGTADGGFLSYCQNAVFENGRIATRKGLGSSVDRVLDISEFADKISCEYRLTKTVFHKDNKAYTIAYADILYDYSNRFCKVFLIGEDASVISAGSLHFRRADESSFFIPDNICFYTGAPQQGGGIFALVLLRNIENEEQSESAIYEISETFDSWSKVNEYYIPTVYINGRGNRYEFAEQSGQVYEGTPKTLEAINILNGRFFAYYSSDGYSSSFRLPFSNIADSSVLCRIYTAPDSYLEWSVAAGETTATKTFYNAEVTMNVSREKGMVYFTVESGFFSVPLMEICKENNIRITAQCNTNADLDTVVTAKCSAVSGSDIYFSGCKDKNRVYYTSYENPLYFPLITDNSVGSADSEAKALIAESGKLILFKESAVYRVNIKSAKALNSTSLLADNGAVFYGVNTLSSDILSESLGSRYKDTVAFINGRCIWFDGESIYLMSQSAGEFYNISKEIAPFLKDLSDTELEQAYGLSAGNNYILLLGCKAVIIKLESTGLNGNTNGICRSIWQFPADICLLGALSLKENAVFLCETVQENVCYTADLSGDSDTVIKTKNGIKIAERYDIETRVKFKDYSFGDLCRSRRIKYIQLRLSAKDSIDVSVMTEFGSSNFSIAKSDLSGEKTSTVRLITDIYGSQTVGFGFKATKGITLGDCDIYYIDS